MFIFNKIPFINPQSRFLIAVAQPDSFQVLSRLSVEEDRITAEAGRQLVDDVVQVDGNFADEVLKLAVPVECAEDQVAISVADVSAKIVATGEDIDVR